MRGNIRAWILDYGLAVLTTSVATWLHVWTRPYLGENVPFITFFPAVFVTAYFARFGPTVLAVMLSGLAAAFWSIPPAGSIWPVNAADWLGLGLFLVFGIAIALLGEFRHRETARVQLERERFLVTLASIGDGVIVTDRQGKVTFMNSIAVDLTGWQMDAARGLRLEQVLRIVDEQSGNPVDHPVARVLGERRVVGLSNHSLLIAKDGGRHPIDDSAAPVRDAKGRLLGVVLVFRDVSQQRASQLTRGRLAALVDSSEDAILGQSFDGIVTDWNHGAERLFGYTSEETVGKPIFSTIVPPDRKDELLRVLGKVRLGQRIEQFETVRRRKDGTRIPVAIRISPIRNAAGEVVGASAIDRDISRQRAAEQRRNARLAVTQILSQEYRIEPAMEQILATIGTALDWPVGCFWQLRPDEQVLRCQQFWTADSSQLAEFRETTLRAALVRGSDLPGRVWQSGRPTWNPNAAADTDPTRAAPAKLAGLRGGFAWPIASQQFLGIIEFLSHSVQPPDEDVLEMIETIGGQIGLFIERRQAERNLRRRERELNDFFENAAVGLHWVGSDGIVLRVNQAELDLLGYSREQYEGRHIAEFHADPPVIEDLLKRLGRGEELRDYPARLRCKDGSVRHVLIDSNVMWEDGRFIHTRCFTRDITDRKQTEAALLENEQRLRLALEAGRMGTWEWRIPTGEITWSPTLEAIHGLEPGGFDGTFEAYQQDMHPEDRQRVLDTIRQTSEQGREHFLQYRIVRPDGDVRWLEARGKLFHDTSGRPTRRIGVCSDISERKHLERQLEKQLGELADAEARIRSVVDNVIDGIITIDDRGHVTSFNPAAERIFGYVASEVVGKNVGLLMPEPHRSQHDEYIANYLETGEAKILGVGREVVGVRKNGSTFPVDLAVSEYRLDQQRCFTGVVRDITQRKHIEQSLVFLAEASKSLSSLTDYKNTLRKVAHLAVPGFADWCGVDILDAQGALRRLAVAHVDPTKVHLAEQLTRRYPAKDDDPHGAPRVVRTGRPELIPRIDDDMLRGAARDDEHLRLLRELRLTSYLCVPLKTKDKIWGAMAFVSSDSSRLYNEDDLAMARDLAHRAAIAIENASLYHELREADRRKDEFLAMLAHELRNPLAPIRSGLDILMLDGDHPRETIALMQRQLEHVVRLVDDLLDVSRIMQGKVELRKEPVAVAGLVRRSVEVVRPLVDGHGQDLVVHMPAEPLWLDADPVRLAQILENLLNNASKYTDAAGRIELTVARRDDRVELSVHDTGVGIEPDLLPKVFDLFTQSSRSLDRAQGGLGIGLTLVRRLVEMHEGTVSVHSDGLGRGATFTVRLPVVEAASHTEARSEPRIDEQPHRVVLIVDDNVGAARMLAMLLERLHDHQVETTHDGVAALAKIKEMHPEVVFLDIGLPKLDGYQVATEVRKDRELDDVLLVALTGYGQQEDRRKSREAGFDVHLVKPPSLDQINEILRHPSRQSHASQAR